MNPFYEDLFKYHTVRGLKTRPLGLSLSSRNFCQGISAEAAVSVMVEVGCGGGQKIAPSNSTEREAKAYQVEQSALMNNPVEDRASRSFFLYAEVLERLSKACSGRNFVGLVLHFLRRQVLKKLSPRLTRFSNIIFFSNGYWHTLQSHHMATSILLLCRKSTSTV